MFCVINLMVMTLNPKWNDRPNFVIIYYPMLGATLVFYAN